MRRTGVAVDNSGDIQWQHVSRSSNVLREKPADRAAGVPRVEDGRAAQLNRVSGRVATAGLRAYGARSGLSQGRRSALWRLCLWAGVAAITSGQSASRPAFADPVPGLSVHCLAPAWPEPPLAGSPPIVAEWTASHVPESWARPPCVDWGLHRFSAFVAVAGSYQASGMEAVLSRIASSSAFKGMRYWSVTDGRLESLILDAYAVQGPPDIVRRSDFTAAELQTERELF